MLSDRLLQFVQTVSDIVGTLANSGLGNWLEATWVVNCMA